MLWTAGSHGLLLIDTIYRYGGRNMERMLTLIGNLSALAGIALSAGAGVARILGFYLLSDYTTMTLFQVGTGLMVLACLCKIQVMQMRSR